MSKRNPDRIARGHNPCKITNRVLGEAYRCLTKAEFETRYDSDTTIPGITAWRSTQRWDKENNWNGNSRGMTYRVLRGWKGNQ